MNINMLFRAAERQCGRVLRILPKEEIGSPREYMMEVLQDETLPTLDTVFPRLLKKSFTINAMTPLTHSKDEYYDQQVDDRYAVYRIPLELTDGCEIVTIKDFVPSTQDSRGGTSSEGYTIGSTVLGFRNMTGPNKWGRYSSANVYESVSMAQLEYVDKMLMGNIQSQFRYYFFPPNIVYISRMYANTGGQFTATFCVKNDPNLISIPDTAYDAVRKLFILDVKASVYGEYGIYSEIDTPSGTISINIQEWATAYDMRMELAEQYRSKAHFRTTSMRSG